MSRSKTRRHKKSSKAVLWVSAPDVQKRIGELISYSNLAFNEKLITCLRSYDSKARAYARIWGLPKVWQITLKQTPHYIIEVLSEKYDVLNDAKKDEVLLHELAHIPNNFSGSLLPHIKRGKRNFGQKVDKLIKEVRMNKHSK